MKLHLFNPEHDIALAINKASFTPPHAARQLHHDLGYLAALWADDGDFVLVDDKVVATESLKRIGCDNLSCFLIEPSELHKFSDITIDVIGVWGWDKAIKRYFEDSGLRNQSALPADDVIAQWRLISSRGWTAENVMKPLILHCKDFVGSSTIATSVSEALSPKDLTSWVLKSPWSCSGRGVRYVDTDTVTKQLEGWVANIIDNQGYIMIEPLYTKIVDLAAEFIAKADGTVDYLGLSLFETKNGAYTGNIIAPETRKREVVSKYISLDMLDSAISSIKKITSSAFAGRYLGHFGVDMMIVVDKEKGICLHPCVEMNLRRTMGYVALQLKAADHIPTKVMRICKDKKYRLRISDSDAEMWK